MKQFTSDQFTWKNGVGTAELSSLVGMSGNFSRFTIKSTRTKHTRTYELDTQSPGYEDGWDGEFKMYTDNLFDGTKVIIWNYWLALSFICYHTTHMNNNNDLLPVVTQRMMEMYGVPSIGKWYDEQFLYPEDKDSPFVGGHKLLVMSMMSDVQEMIDRSLMDEARHTLNRAKWIISNKL